MRVEIGTLVWHGCRTPCVSVCSCICKVIVTFRPCIISNSRHIAAFLHTCVHPYIHTHGHTYICTCMLMYVHTYLIPTYLRTYIPTPTYTYIPTPAYLHTCIYGIHAYVHTHTHRQAYLHTCIRIDKHVDVCMCFPDPWHTFVKTNARKPFCRNGLSTVWPGSGGRSDRSNTGCLARRFSSRLQALVCFTSGFGTRPSPSGFAMGFVMCVRIASIASWQCHNFSPPELCGSETDSLSQDRCFS